MWKAIVCWLKGLLGGKVTTQIGRGNRAISGSSSGDNSPVVSAGRDAYIQVQSKQNELTTFNELEQIMPDLLNQLREGMADDPLIRDIIVSDKKSLAYNYTVEHFHFSADEHPRVWEKIRILENHGLVSEVRHRFAYRISEDFARYLRAGN